MLKQMMIGQPGSGRGPVTNVDGIIELVRAGASKFDSAIAYVTDSGVDALIEAIGTGRVELEWTQLAKRFLVSIDWYRSDPTALQRLASLPNCSVRVHDGERVVNRSGCVPFVPWHPKWFSVQGNATRGILVGSGNLSRNGIKYGHEAGCLQIIKNPSSRAEKSADAAIHDGQRWFDKMWKQATPLDDIAVKYHNLYAALPKVRLPRNDDISAESERVGKSRALDMDKLAALTSGTNLWIESGRLTQNRGPGREGNQLMMSAFTRVYFGFRAAEVPQNTAIGSVTIENSTDRRTTSSAPIRFSDNSMDVITLPVPESPWPSSYGDQVLHFEKISRGKELHFVLTVHAEPNASTWLKKWENQDTSYTMTSGRRWGVFG
ncbi:hypothetical protein [Rhodococcus sp. 27YEA6]|uniref:hypothetical protein n=1 Tax=Rhodococcus sp. 27YEA6 TaxID=3156273 RepID=UPI0038396FFC